MQLRTLIEGLDAILLSGSLDEEVSGIQHDSRQIQPGDLFVCIKGLKHDGHAFIPQAAAKGAKAFIVEYDGLAFPPSLPVIRVKDARLALAHASCRFYGEPSQKLILIGVTGTNGKTTTTYLIEAILKEAGLRIGLLGTLCYRFGGLEVTAERTTPEASDLQAFLARILAMGADSAVLEVSSHSLALSRVEGCEFDVAVFTNLTQDHLDFHGSLEAYFQAKAKLFEELGEKARKGIEKAAFLNLDDHSVLKLTKLTRARVFTYGLKQRGGDLSAEEMELSFEGIRAKIVSPWGSFTFRSLLVGEYNLSNILAAAGVGLYLGAKPEEVAKGIASLKRVPGRFEKVDAGQPFGVVVDYAHTPDALERVLQTARAFCQGKLIVVFGCGGDRDRGKRPRMGEVSARIADLSILTSDNPRNEEPERIIAEIEEGMKKVCRKHDRYVTIPDRRLAISEAVSLARPDDLVLVAGKGHEAYQIIGEEMIPFDDRQVAYEALRTLGYRSVHR